MKIKNIITVLLIAFIWASCAPAAKVVPTKTATPTSTFTPAPPILTITPTPTLENIADAEMPVTETPTTESTTASLQFTTQQRLIADQYISVFENDTTVINYEYAEDIGDQRGITAGRAGFTSATGDMLYLIEQYTKGYPDNTLAPYIPELRRLEQIYADHNYDLGGGSDDTSGLVGLSKAWKENAQLQAFRDLQDAIVDELYFNPALTKAQSVGLKYPLSLLCFYDSIIQHGGGSNGGLDDIIAHATSMTNSQTPLDGADEPTWMKNFLTYRAQVLVTWDADLARVHELEDLIDAKNTQLAPFKLVIDDWGDETFNLPGPTQ